MPLCFRVKGDGDSAREKNYDKIFSAEERAEHEKLFVKSSEGFVQRYDEATKTS